MQSARLDSQSLADIAGNVSTVVWAVNFAGLSFELAGAAEERKAADP